MAHGRRPQAAAPSSGGGALFFLAFSRDSPPGLFSSNFQLSLPLPMFLSSFFLPFPLFSRSVFFSLVSVFLSSRFLPSFGSLSFGSLSFRVFFLFPSFLHSSQRSWALFIEAKGAVFYSSHGEQPAGRPLGAAAEVRWVVRGGWSAIVFGRWAPGEREGPAKISKKSTIFPFFPAACSGGKKKDEQCRSKRHCSALLIFFFFEWMKRRRFG